MSKIVTASKNGIQHKLLSVQEKLDIVDKMNDTSNFAGKKNCSRAWNLYVNLK